MEEIIELYEKVLMKDEFRKNLSSVVHVSEKSQKQYFSGRKSFRKHHIPTVLNCLKIQLQIDEQTKDINVKAWCLLQS